VPRAVWIVSLSLGSLLGCTGRCFKNVDCGQGSFCEAGRCETECFEDRDCREPPECEDNPTACRPKGLRCTATGRCVGPIVPADPAPAPGLEESFDAEIDGFDAPPGSGFAFVVDELSIAGANRGFDVDGICDDDGCIDNIAAEIGGVANRQIAQGVRDGTSILLMELVGLENPYQGNETSATLKIYAGRDADSPPFPDDNFRAPSGSGTCCNFKITPQSLVSVPPQAGARSPIRIEKGRLESLAPVPIQFVLTLGSPPHPEVRIRSTRVRAVVPASLEELTDGILGGAVPLNALAAIDNPYCREAQASQCPREVPAASKLLDLVTIFAGPRPDIDGDGDGLECVLDDTGDGLVDACCDGTSQCPPRSDLCRSARIPVTDVAASSSCARDPRMADAYSIGFRFTAVAANVVGIAE